MRKAIFLMTHENNRLNQIFTENIKNQLRELVDLYEKPIIKQKFEEDQKVLKEAEIVFSTWGMPSLKEEEIKTYMPNLKAVFYAAGTVQSFARPFLNLGIQVFSAWAANAVPVAEFTLSQIILANKGYFQCSHRIKTEGYRESGTFSSHYPGNYAIKVGILGAGMIGTNVINMMKALKLKVEVLVFDPFLSDEKSIKLGVKKTDLMEIFSTCQTISNHLADNPQTKGILNKEYFNAMLPSATFINTGRGAQVVEADLIQALKDVPTRTALLDVSDPEPPLPESELYSLDNIILTPHIAGSTGHEVERLAQYMIDEFKHYEKNEPLNYQLTLEMLKTMA